MLFRGGKFSQEKVASYNLIYSFYIFSDVLGRCSGQSMISGWTSPALRAAVNKNNHRRECLAACKSTGHKLAAIQVLGVGASNWECHCGDKEHSILKQTPIPIGIVHPAQTEQTTFGRKKRAASRGCYIEECAPTEVCIIDTEGKECIHFDVALQQDFVQCKFTDLKL